MDHQTLVLTLLNGTAALLGIYFVVRAVRAYREHRNRHLGILAVAVTLLTVGLVVEGIIVRIVGLPIATAHVTEAAFGLLAFAVLVYSLHA